MTTSSSKIALVFLLCFIPFFECRNIHILHNADPGVMGHDSIERTSESIPSPGIDPLSSSESVRMGRESVERVLESVPSPGMGH